MYSIFKRARLRYIFDYIVVAASVLLMAAITVEILNGGGDHRVSAWYVHLQLVICVIFIADFFVSMAAEKCKMSYFWSHLPILVISLPYLSMPYERLFGVSSEGALLVALIPILRGFVAIYILLRWVIRGENALRLLYAYLLTLLSFTYISALIFYECELLQNPALMTFGDAIWWAAMGLTTTELTITPLTVTGKILAVLLPLSGMLFLPIATNYLLSLRSRRRAPKSSQEPPK